MLANLLVRKKKVHQNRLIVTKLYSFLCGCQRGTQIIMERQQMHQLGVSPALWRSPEDVVPKILSGNKPLAMQDSTGMDSNFVCPPMAMKQCRIPDLQVSINFLFIPGPGSEQCFWLQLWNSMWCWVPCPSCLRFSLLTWKVRIQKIKGGKLYTAASSIC